MKTSMQQKALKYFESNRVQNWAVFCRGGFVCEWNDSGSRNWIDCESQSPYVYRVSTGSTSILTEGLLKALGIKKKDCRFIITK